jgi:eukaryotic-like serine/threonine-protein kinase
VKFQKPLALHLHPRCGRDDTIPETHRAMKDPDSETPGPGTLPTRAERRRRTAPPRSTDASALPEGFLLGKYRIHKLLGSGGMGTVYEAVHVEMGKAVALKVLREEAAADPHARARFLREAAASSRIQHPHVVNVIDYGAHESLPFIVLQLLRGEDLSDRLDRAPGGLSVAEAADILLAICAGVYAAHGAGVIHRDLKPKNIFLARLSREEISPKVLDFGISKIDDLLVGAALTDPGDLLGTTHYLAPEQLVGLPVEPRTDQHALGVVLYECLTGRRPYDGESRHEVMQKIQSGRFVPPSRLRPDLPPELEQVVLRALAHEPAGRFPTVHVLGAALLRFASEKRQVAWADYYGGPQAAVPPAPSPIEAPAAPPPANELAPETRLIEPTDPAAPRTHTQKTYLDRGRSKAPQPAAVEPTREQTLSPRSAPSRKPARPSGSSRRAGWLSALAAGLVLATAARLLTRMTGDLAGKSEAQPAVAPGPDADLASAEAPPPSQEETIEANPPPLLPETSPPARPDAPPDDVVIRIADAPPGLVAFVDGREVYLPIRLPRGSAPVRVTFRAPGHEPAERTVSAESDATVSVPLVRSRSLPPAGEGRFRRPSPPPPPPPPPISPLVPRAPEKSPSPAPILEI